jgi:uncharacterized repeat protein (TIGR03803 family)
MSHTRILNLLKMRWNGWCQLALAFILVIAFAVAPLHAQFTYQDLYDFNCSAGGCQPWDFGQLTQGADGNLYGTTQQGGSYGYGTIFKVTPSAPAVYTNLWQFDGVVGNQPVSSLTLASDGNFYGTTSYGGTFNDGILYRFTPPGSLTVLHSFNGTDGSFPTVAPVEATDGNLYGVTDSGTIYRVTLPAGKFKLLPHNTKGVPSQLYLASDGNLYGTTFDGGSNGTLFRMITPAGTIKIIYSFSGADGTGPNGPLTQGKDGYLYGTTSFGGANDRGEAFKTTLSGKLTVLHSFDNIISGTNNDGADPEAGLLAASDGYLYGANYDAGAYGFGTIFQISQSGTFTKLFDLTGFSGAAPGSQPFTTLMEHTNGSFYGLNLGGGPTGTGTFYSLTPPNPIQILIVEGPIFLKPGVAVEILGANLEQVFAVDFGGVQAQFQPGTNNYLIADVPNDAVDGLITVTLQSGQQIESQGAVHILPEITNLDPSSGQAGSQVGIVGGGFTGATKVTFGGVKATSFRVASPTAIQATVPTGAKTGKVKVMTPNGTATSKETFTVN